MAMADLDNPRPPSRRRPRNYGADAPAWAVGIASVLLFASAVLLEIGVDWLPGRGEIAALVGAVLTFAAALALVAVTRYRARHRKW